MRTATVQDKCFGRERVTGWLLDYAPMQFWDFLDITIFPDPHLVTLSIAVDIKFHFNFQDINT